MTITASPTIAYDDLLKIIHQLREENQWLKEQMNLSRATIFGASTESHLQADFFGKENESQDAPPETQTIKAHQRKTKKKGRNIDTKNLPREIIHYDLDEADKICSGCDTIMVAAGQDVSEQIDIEPAKLQVIEHVQAKYCCRACNAIKQAKKPESPLGKVMATTRLVAEVITKKYQHHLPLYRQSKIFQQDGAKIPDNTLNNWVMLAGEYLLPPGEAMKSQVRQSNRLQVDETPVRALKQKSKAYLWCFHSYDPRQKFMWYELAGSREGEVAERILGDYTGILQTDGYSGYNRFRKQSTVITPGCWVHARRKFADIIKSKSIGEGLAQKIINAMSDLFDVDSDYSEANPLAQCADIEAWYAGRLEARKETSVDIVNQIKTLVSDGLKGPLPKSMIGKALEYISRQWEYLVLMLKHGDIELSTNWVESAIRPFALGRKNWMFVKSVETGQVTGLFFSLVQSCIANNIEPRKYITYVLDQIPALRRKIVDPVALLPHLIDRDLLNKA